MTIVHVLLFGLLLLTVACQSVTDSDQQQGSIPAVEMLYASQQCGYGQATPRATWIDSALQLEASIKKIQRNTLGGKAINFSKLDFKHEIVLLVEMGQQSTLGYQIKLREAGSLTVKQGKAQLTLDWVKPSAGSIVAQTVSSPCLLLKLDRGNYTSVQILNRQGTVKASTGRDQGNNRLVDFWLRPWV